MRIALAWIRSASCSSLALTQGSLIGFGIPGLYSSQLKTKAVEKGLCTPLHNFRILNVEEFVQRIRLYQRPRRINCADVTKRLFVTRIEDVANKNVCLRSYQRIKI